VNNDWMESHPRARARERMVLFPRGL